MARRPSERATDARAFISVEIEACPLVLAMGVGIFLATLPPPARRETPAVPGLRIAFAIALGTYLSNPGAQNRPPSAT